MTKASVRVNRFWFGAALALASLVSGCGGGIHGSGADAGAQERTFNFGPLTSRAVGLFDPPVTSGGSGAVVTGFAGTKVTSLVLSEPTSNALNSAATLAQTKIVFSHDGLLYLMNSDGSNVTGIINETADPTKVQDLSVTWSPDGTKIAFTRADFAANTRQIYVVNADGSGRHKISDGTGVDQFPAWSPDGSKIAFNRDVAGHRFIFTMDPNGGSLTQVSSGQVTSNYTYPTWSPDGSKLAYYANDPAVGHLQVFIMNSDGTGAHNMSALGSVNSVNLFTPSWSPDGNQIAVVFTDNSGHLHVYTLDTNSNLSALKQITRDAFDDRVPTWSPDSSRIIFSRTVDPTHSQLFTVAADGTGTPVALTAAGHVDGYVAWSPYVTKRTLVGLGGLLGNSGSGFIFGQKGDVVTSVLSFNALTPAGTGITAPTGIAVGNSNYIFSITASDTLNGLSYMNGFFSQPVQVLLDATANGALVSYNAQTGTVASVLPYAATKAAGPGSQMSSQGNVLVVHARFLGVWNEAGKNVAPNGASEARIDIATGRLVDFR